MESNKRKQIELYYCKLAHYFRTTFFKLFWTKIGNTSKNVCEFSPILHAFSDCLRTISDENRKTKRSRSAPFIMPLFPPPPFEQFLRQSRLFLAGS
ncbi:hypothetical protein, partial [Aeribacillus pallidus]|uniref:hypothetical protein n=1 Tax=Aeribacillus pallidus TaxID=33936 RepID=UPI001C989486